MWPNWTRIANVLEANGISAEAESLAANDPFVRLLLDVGNVQPEYPTRPGEWRYIELILASVGISSCRQTAAALSVLMEYHRSENLWENVPEFVKPALLDLRDMGLQLVVVSNANGTLIKAFDRLGLRRMVDLIIDSGETGPQKPDPRLFDIALQRSGADRATTIHAGDFYNIDIVGARAAGLIGVLVDQANLYAKADCLRVRSLAELPGLIRRGMRKRQV